jgi:hypothetical protein
MQLPGALQTGIDIYIGLMLSTVGPGSTCDTAVELGAGLACVCISQRHGAQLWCVWPVVCICQHCCGWGCGQLVMMTCSQGVYRQCFIAGCYNSGKASQCTDLAHLLAMSRLHGPHAGMLHG